MTDAQLAERAIANRARAYAPYSGFAVGAALLTKSGKIYDGANIENAAYGPSNCAERSAFFAAVLAGERDFAAIAVAGGLSGQPGDFCYPCGVCRQVMMEFCDPSAFRIIVTNGGETRAHTLAELLPHGFGAADLTP